MGQIDISGTVQAGPGSVSEGSYPSMTASMLLKATPNPKPWQVCTGTIARSVNAVIGGGSWVALDGIGSSKTVQECDTFIFHSSADVLLRITQKDPGAPGVPTVQTRRITGLHIIECGSATAITLIEIQGAASIEYVASGQS